MAQGLIDFARHGQLSIITPFAFMGAMAPVTVEAAMTLSHAEALAAITLTQLVRPGAPVCCGTFTSNVDMKSGAPAFGTPEHFRATLIAGQLAQLVDLQWRCASGSAANINDSQAANETQFALWGCLMAGAMVVIHTAGWLEGGLTVSYEKLVTNMEVLQMVAELCNETPPDNPLVTDWANFGAWMDSGAQTASQRATGIWKDIVSCDAELGHESAQIGALQDFIKARSASCGALPES